MDGTLTLTLTAADFNEEGVATYYMIQSEAQDALCHLVTVTQSGLSVFGY